MYYVSKQFKANVELRGQSKNHETHHWSKTKTHCYPFVVKRHKLVMFTILTSHEDEYREITFRKNAQNKHW